MTERIEYGTKAAADAAREKHEEYLCTDDDRRLKTVAYSSDTPDSVLETERIEAADGRGERTDGPGQVPLSDSERERIDFSQKRANTAHARSVKGIAQAEGVEDWVSYYDGTLTVDEHREVMADAARESGSRSAEESVEEKAGRAARAAQSSQCDHARGHCENGDPEACEFLTETCGYSEEEIGEFIDDTPAGETEQTELVTVGGGEYPEMEVTPETAGALRRGWQGYKAGVSDLEAAMSQARDSVINARQAWRAVNRIREANGQEPMHPDRLHTLLDALDGMPGSIPEVRTLDHYGPTDDRPGDSPEQDPITLGSVGTTTYDWPNSIRGWTGERVTQTLAKWTNGQYEIMLRVRKTRTYLGWYARLYTLPHEPGQKPVIEYSVGRNSAAYTPDDGHDEILSVMQSWADDPPDSDPDSEQTDQFASEQQGTLGVDADAEEAAEEKQVTLTGDDEAGNETAPTAWRRNGTMWEGGPHTIQLDSQQRGSWTVRLTGPAGPLDLATNLPDPTVAEEVAEGVTDRVQPNQVTAHNADATLQEAAAAAKSDALPDSGADGLPMIEPYWCPAEGCDYGTESDKSLAAVRSHINAMGDDHDWDTLKPLLHEQGESNDDQPDDPDDDPPGTGGAAATDEDGDDDQQTEGVEQTETPENGENDQQDMDQSNEYQQQIEQAEQPESNEESSDEAARPLQGRGIRAARRPAAEGCLSSPLCWCPAARSAARCPLRRRRPAGRGRQRGSRGVRAGRPSDRRTGG